MPLPFLCRDVDVREGIKVPSSILDFHFLIPLLFLILLFSKGKKRGEQYGRRTCPRISLAPLNQ